MQQDHTYTVADIERYYSGKMTDGEMHALEKAALKDPFLADALEGYGNTRTPSKDIAELKQRLFEKEKKKNKFFVINKNSPWLKIAAVLMLIAGSGYFIYLLTAESGVSKLVSIRDTGTNKMQETVPAKADSVLVANKIPEVIASSEKKVSDAVNNNSKGAPAAAGSKESPQRDLSLEKDKATAMLTIPERDKNYNRDRNPVELKQASNDVKPANSVFLKDSSSIGYTTTADKTDQPAEQTRKSKSLEEVTVSASGVSRQRKEFSASSNLLKKSAVTDSAVLRAAADLQRFDQYVKANINIPKDEAGNSYKGKVSLSFEVNKKGYPKKIKVQRSLCASCDDEAIRLLKKGPKWKYENGKRQTVTIDF